jgi:hypothetical protein
VTKSGLMSSGGVGFTIGSQMQSTDAAVAKGENSFTTGSRILLRD